MTVAFDENTSFILIAISCKVMAALKGFNAIMASLYGRVCPSAPMVVYYPHFPITHCLEGASNRSVRDLIALFAPTLKSQLCNGIAGGAFISSCNRFLPFPYAAKKWRVIQQRFQPLFVFRQVIPLADSAVDGWLSDTP